MKNAKTELAIVKALQSGPMSEAQISSAIVASNIPDALCRLIDKKIAARVDTIKPPVYHSLVAIEVSNAKKNLVDLPSHFSNPLSRPIMKILEDGNCNAPEMAVCLQGGGWMVSKPELANTPRTL